MSFEGWDTVFDDLNLLAAQKQKARLSDTLIWCIKMDLRRGIPAQLSERIQVHVRQSQASGIVV